MSILISEGLETKGYTSAKGCKQKSFHIGKGLKIKVNLIREWLERKKERKKNKKCLFKI